MTTTCLSICFESLRLGQCPLKVACEQSAGAWFAEWRWTAEMTLSPPNTEEKIL